MHGVARPGGRPFGARLGAQWSAIQRLGSPEAVAAFFVLAGLGHFIKPRWYEAIMPPYLPWHRPLVFASGAAEIAGGLLALPRRTRSFGALWLIALLFAVFPANIHMAMHPEAYPRIPKAGLWLRLPLQIALMAWVARSCRDAEG